MSKKVRPRGELPVRVYVEGEANDALRVLHRCVWGSARAPVFRAEQLKRSSSSAKQAPHSQLSTQAD